MVAAAAVAEAVNLRLLPGRSTMYRVLGLNGRPGRIPDVTPVPTTSGAFASKARGGRTVGWTIAAPESSDPLPIAVALHGYGGSHRTFFGNGLGYERFLAAHIANGGAPFAVAGVDGGDRYWHRRADGDDPGAMVLDEFVPMLEQHGFDTRRLAFTGNSMGGYGALRFGGLLGPGKVRAVAALSPALWTAAGDTARGAFDDAEDFRANTVTGRQHELDGIPVRIDVGTGDGFEPAVRTYVAGFTTKPSGGFEPGAHDAAFWRRTAPAQIAFLARHLHS